MGHKNTKVDFNNEEAIEEANCQSRGEAITKLVLESLFDRPFTTVHPNFLRYKPKDAKRATNLELDLYNDDLRLAIEYQGDQHYIYVPYFHKTKEGLIKSLNRDHYKRKRCYKNQIILLEIPDLIKETDLADYIINRLPRCLDKYIKTKRLKLARANKILLLK